MRIDMIYILLLSSVPQLYLRKVHGDRTKPNYSLWHVDMPLLLSYILTFYICPILSVAVVIQYLMKVVFKTNFFLSTAATT